jgi:hypothetical protein
LRPTSAFGVLYTSAVDVGERKVVPALDIGRGAVGFEAEDQVAALQVVADLAATEGPMRFPVHGEVGKAGGAERIVEVVVAEGLAAETADIEAGPVIDRRRLDREIGGERRRPQSQHTERDGGERDSFHC